MKALDDLSTVPELAAKLRKTEAETLAFLRKLRVPVTDGVFSERLLRARVEQGQRPSDVFDGAINHLGRLGLIADRVDIGRPTVVTLGVKKPTLIGSPEFSADDEDETHARLLVHPGEHLTCILQVAHARVSGSASFNVRFGGQRKIVVAPLHAFYVLEGDELWLVKRLELEAFREEIMEVPAPPPPRGRRTFTFFPTRENTWRLSFAKGTNDFEGRFRVQQFDSTPANIDSIRVGPDRS